MSDVSVIHIYGSFFQLPPFKKSIFRIQQKLVYDKTVFLISSLHKHHIAGKFFRILYLYIDSLFIFDIGY